ncbi:MAG: DUF4191 domain-containing protein [Promicromonosporaceae bacterium]|nr:DUF4191 domain-containing protein [Promicromonosporaceae bacterium]
MARKSKQEPKVKKQRWYHQVWQAYQMTRATDPAVTWIMLGVFFGVLAAFMALGFTVFNWPTGLIMGLPFAFLAAMFMLTRRAEAAAYRRIEGQAGAARSAMGTVRGRGQWTFEDEPVAFSPRSQDMVFRGVGRPGVVLVSEGPAVRAGRLLEDERKKTSRFLAGVPITLIQMGNDDGQVPLVKLAKSIKSLKNQLTPAEATEVSRRLSALGGINLGLPKGIDFNRARPDRKGMRGR